MHAATPMRQAHFHNVGALAAGSVFLEKYSRSLVWLERAAAERLDPDCDTDVDISVAVADYFRSSRCAVPRAAATSRRACRPGIELTLLTTNSCNLACSYCFARDLYEGRKVLKSDAIVSAIRQFLRQSGQPISSLILFGGEPLLAFKAIQQAWPTVARMFASHQQSMPSLAIVTNGSLIDDRTAAFLAEHDFAVTVSVDGPREIHDLCRPRRGGKPSYDAVVIGIEKLKRAGVYYAIEGTYTARHLAAGISVTEIVDHAISLGAQETHVMPAFPEATSGIQPDQESQVAELFAIAARRAAERYLASQSFELSYAVNVVYSFVNDLPRRYICTAGIDKFTVMENGDVMPCYLVCDAANRLGSLADENRQTTTAGLIERTVKKYQALSRDALPGCRDCWAADWCFACYGPGQMRHARLGAPGGLDCKVYKAMIEMALLTCARHAKDRTAAADHIG